MPEHYHPRLPRPTVEAQMLDSLAGVKRGKKTEREKEEDQAAARVVRLLEETDRLKRNPRKGVLAREIERRGVDMPPIADKPRDPIPHPLSYVPPESGTFARQVVGRSLTPMERGLATRERRRPDLLMMPPQHSRHAVLPGPKQ